MLGKRIAFTLVELLVVISIIVLLLSILMPAANRAIYQAQLVQCGTNQKVVLSALNAYAHDHSRFFPYRGLPGNRVNWPIGAQVLTHPAEGADGPGKYDVRPPLEGYLSVNKNLNDPLTNPVDLEIEHVAGESGGTYILASYHLWHDWAFKGDWGGEGMYKLGDRLEWNQRFYTFLISDMDFRWSSGTQEVATASHPDFGILFNNRAENAPSPFTIGNITVSAWEFWGSNKRKPLDLNFGYDDGSVRRLASVEFDDERVSLIPSRYDENWAHTQVPRQ